jgi:hypothetical protein
MKLRLWAASIAAGVVLSVAVSGAVAHGDAGQALTLGQTNTSTTITRLIGRLQVDGWAQLQYILVPQGAANSYVVHSASGNPTDPIVAGCEPADAPNVQFVLSQVQGYHPDYRVLAAKLVTNSVTGQRCVDIWLNKPPTDGLRVSYLLIASGREG